MNMAKKACEAEDTKEWKAGTGDWRKAEQAKEAILAKMTSGRGRMHDTQTGLYCCWKDVQNGEYRYAIYTDDGDSLIMEMEDHGLPTDLKEVSLHMMLAIKCKEYNQIYEDEGESEMTKDSKFEFVVGFSIVNGVLLRSSCANKLNPTLGDGKRLRDEYYHQLAEILQEQDFPFREKE
jgi:hypothetical protein